MSQDELEPRVSALEADVRRTEQDAAAAGQQRIVELIEGLGTDGGR